jgi:hypothetical protein
MWVKTCDGVEYMLSSNEHSESVFIRNRYQADYVQQQLNCLAEVNARYSKLERDYAELSEAYEAAMKKLQNLPLQPLTVRKDVV